MISELDLARSVPPSRSSEIPKPEIRPRRVPIWAYVVGWLLSLSFPLLAIFTICCRAGIRNRPLAEREAWKGLLCTMLMVSGVTNLIFVGWLMRFPGASFLIGGFPSSQQAAAPPLRDGLTVTEPFPKLPGAEVLSSIEVAERSKHLVFIVSPTMSVDPQRDTFGASAIGAGVLLMATDQGFLLATNRHVIDAELPILHGGATDQVMVITSGWQYARASVVARHKSLDLALLWVRRTGGAGQYRQSITPYSAIPAGEPVFVEGHPQRLYFTLSNGLISRLEGGTLQLSAPVSPGNSGGPVYDNHGNLLGIVTSKMDRETSPNAENLNFATRADAFLDDAGWNFAAKGQDQLMQFRQGEHK